MSSEDQRLFKNDQSDQQPELKRKGKRLVQKGKKKRENIQNQYEMLFSDQASSVSGQESQDNSEDQMDRNQRQKQYKSLIQKKDNRLQKFYQMNQNQVQQHYRQLDKQRNLKNDPKLYAVEATRGKQKSLVIQILVKANYFQQNKKKLDISSACFIENNPGIIFIEAYNINSIKNACKDFQGLKLGRFQQLKSDQITQLFLLKKTVYVPKVKPGDYVRIADGLYRQDLAKVKQLKFKNKKRVQVILVPRIDVAELEKQHQKNKNMDFKDIKKEFKKMKYKKNINRPPAKNLFKQDLPDIPQITLLKLTTNGFIIQSFPLHKLMPASNITPKEILNFRDPRYQLNELDFIKDEIRHVKARIRFDRGEKVKVISGDFKGQKGYIQSIQGGLGLNNNGKILIRPNDKQLRPFQVSPQDIQKYFKKSEHVRVIEGKHQGKTGIVLQIKESTALIYTDNGNQIQVLLNELTVSAGRKTQEIQSQMKKYDMLKLVGSQGVCLLLVNMKDTYKVIDQNNTIKMQQIQKTIRQRMNMDKRLGRVQRLKLNKVSILQILVNQNKICQVKHIYKDIIFVYNNEFYHSMGIQALRTNNCLLYTPALYFDKLKPQYGINKLSAYKSQRPNQQQALEIGRTVLIKSGQWKGYQGIIKGFVRDLVTLKLCAQYKTIKIKRDFIQKEKQQLDYGKTPRYGGGQTIYVNSPRHMNNTPMRPYNDEY